MNARSFKSVTPGLAHVSHSVGDFVEWPALCGTALFHPIRFVDRGVSHCFSPLPQWDILVELASNVDTSKEERMDFIVETTLLFSEGWGEVEP